MTNDAWKRDLTTHTGFKFHVRPVVPDDEPGLAKFFEHVSPEDLRFRFLSTVKEMSHDRLAAMTQVDHLLTENFIALTEDGKSIIATAMLACDDTLDKGEVAISVRKEDKHKGVGWELLSHIANFAAAKGVKTIESLEDRRNREAIELEREHGFVSEEYPGDATLVVLRKRIGNNQD